LNSCSIPYKNSTIFYRIIGKGDPVLLIHGFAEDGEVWHNQINFLKDHYQLIIPDIPGSGKSPFNEQLSTVDDYADAIKAILDNEKITSCILIGHSLGGYITLAFAEKYPQLLKAFGLFHSTAFADSEEKKQVRLKAIDFIKTNGAYTFIKTSAPNLFNNPFKQNYPEQIETLIEQGKNFTSDALIQYYHAMITRPDRTSILKNSTVPILFIIGEHDTAVLLQDSLQQCHLPSQSYINILSNSAHMGMWEEAAKANKIIFNFLAAIK
jgi:pimeloyl-ACP methyl ester carboxylesterase